MSVVLNVEHFFGSLFAHHGNGAQLLIHGVSAYVSLALPIVADIDRDLKSEALPTEAQKLAMVERFLARYEPDLQKLSDQANLLAALPASDLWHDLAVYALTTLVPPGTEQRLLRLAVEMAYNLWVESQASASAPAA